MDRDTEETIGGEGMFLFREEESGPYAESRRYWKSVAALVAHLAATGDRMAGLLGVTR